MQYRYQAQTCDDKITDTHVKWLVHASAQLRCKIQWNLGYTCKSELKNLDVEQRGTYK